MQNEQSVAGNETPAQPSPQLQVTPGYQTTSGQFTAIFTIAALIFSFFGYQHTPDQIEGWVTLVENFLRTLGPIIAIIPVLMTYINSRGKVASNTVKANATIMAPVVLPSTLVSGGGIEGIAGTIIGGDNWKDPKRYENLLNLAVELGVPGADKADKVNQQIHPADLVTNILGMFNKRR